ncbi:MAG: hypothetical protein IPJ77_21570 [Planctomycetes bacterium]|nr:hypothetical protein [Planctomycetota bacterium]
MATPAALALALPGVEQGIACAGTALESRTFLVRKKTFLFVSKTQLRLKLERSAAKAKERGYDVGKNGWLKLELAALPPPSVLKAWISESHALFAGAERAPGTKAKTPRRSKR